MGVRLEDADFVVIAARRIMIRVKNYFDTHCIEDDDRSGAGGESGCCDGDQVDDSGGLLPESVCEVCVLGVRRLNLLFFPEFLRESKALYDNLYPFAYHSGGSEDHRC